MMASDGKTPPMVMYYDSSPVWWSGSPVVKNGERGDKMQHLRVVSSSMH